VNKELGPEMKSTGEAIRFIKDLKDPGEAIRFIKDLKDPMFRRYYAEKSMYLSR
jgi:carbamoyl-phosphate synthase large subunit